MDREYNFFVSRLGSNWGRRRGGYSHSSYRSMIRFSEERIIVNSTTANTYNQYYGFDRGDGSDSFTTNDIHSGIFTREEISSVKLSSRTFVGNTWCLVFCIPLIASTLARRYNVFKKDGSSLVYYIGLGILLFLITFLALRMRVIIVKLKNGKKYIIPWKDSIFENITPDEQRDINDIMFRFYNLESQLHEETSPGYRT